MEFSGQLTQSEAFYRIERKPTERFFFGKNAAKMNEPVFRILIQNLTR